MIEYQVCRRMCHCSSKVDGQLLPVCIHRVVGALVRLGVHLHHVGEQELVGVELGEVSAGQEGRVLVEVAPMC